LSPRGFQTRCLARVVLRQEYPDCFSSTVTVREDHAWPCNWSIQAVKLEAVCLEADDRQGRHLADMRPRCGLNCTNAYMVSRPETSSTDTNLRAFESHRTCFSAEGISNSFTRVTLANRSSCSRWQAASR